MSKTARDFFEGKVEADLGEIQEYLDELELKIENAVDLPDVESRRILAEQRLRLEDGRKKLHELQASSDAAWPGLRAELETFMQSLGDSIKDAARAVEIAAAEGEGSDSGHS
jgi:hypothetical protein